MAAPLIGVILGSLGGCAGTYGAVTEPAPEATARVEALVEAHRTYPRWADFPATPTDMPAATTVAGQVATLAVTGGTLTGEVARLDWTLDDPEAFAAAVRARIAATTVAPATARTQAEIEALAERLRQRGQAPPPIPRR
ncbi:MAG: hypothetical protein ACOH1H_11795 [Brevundimonas sp.]